jgi:hypothetical protein
VLIPLGGAVGDATPADVLQGKTFSNSTGKGLVGTFAFVCPAGLSECNSSCVDTKNNPDYCGDCETACDDSSFCLNGSCAPSGCATDAHCSTGQCINNICRLPKVVFLSSAKYNGNLGGISGADTKCQGLAIAAGFSGTYKAWLSDATTSPVETFNKSEIPYILIDGTIVAQNWGDLVDGNLLTAINIMEDGGSGGTWGNNVWTHTTVTAYPASTYNPCNGWIDATNSYGSSTGTSSRNDTGWTWDPSNGVLCAETKRLYCFEQ